MFSLMLLSSVVSASTLAASVSQAADDGTQTYNVIMIVLTLIQILLGLGPSA